MIVSGLDDTQSIIFAAESDAKKCKKPLDRTDFMRYNKNAGKKGRQLYPVGAEGHDTNFTGHEPRYI